MNLAGLARRWAQTLRHAPGLRQLDGLWTAARGPYRALLRLSRQGVAVNVGGACEVHMPADLAGGSWESYEPQEVRRVAQWVRENPAGLVLDVGCAVGIYSLIVLSASPRAEVIAFDSDLASLRATQRMCSFTDGGRLAVIYGFVSNRHSDGLDARSAAQAAEDKIRQSGVSGATGTTAYRCLGDAGDQNVPVHSLDGLWNVTGYPPRPVLLKCDVEGAEQLVLEGASRLLGGSQTTLSLSVHPPALPRYGHSVQSVRALVEKAGYGRELLSSDHEEHWWCEKR